MAKRLTIAVVQENPVVGDLEGNLAMAKEAILRHRTEDLVVFSECFLSGYPLEDLATYPSFIARVEMALAELVAFVVDVAGPAVVMGAPEEGPDAPYNAAYFVFPDGTKKVARKLDLPNASVFDEVRNFAGGSLRSPVTYKGVRIGVGICEEMWHRPVSSHFAAELADVLVFINGSPFTHGKHLDERLGHAYARVRETGLPLIYSNQFGGQDELVFDGASFAVDARGRLFSQMAAFARDERVLLLEDGDLTVKDWTPGALAVYPTEIEARYLAAMHAGRDYVDKSVFKGVVIGVSGGVDSALSLVLAVDALGADRVLAVSMPAEVNTADSVDDSRVLCEALGVRMIVVPIAEAVAAEMKVGSVVEEQLGWPIEDKARKTSIENVQSRVRGLQLMKVSNEYGLMVGTTGNKSEMLVGFCTAYGDMNGGWNWLKDVYKTQTWPLCRWRNENLPGGALGPAGRVVPREIIDKVPSATLSEGQADEDVLGPYAVLDPILMGIVDDTLGLRATLRRVRGMLGKGIDVVHQGFLTEGHVRFVANLVRYSEWKRRQSAPGGKQSRMALGRDRRFPLVNRFEF